MKSKLKRFLLSKSMTALQFLLFVLLFVWLFGLWGDFPWYWTIIFSIIPGGVLAGITYESIRLGSFFKALHYIYDEKEIQKRQEKEIQDLVRRSLQAKKNRDQKEITLSILVEY